MTLREGKNREVRRVFARVGAKVAALRRTRIGPLADRGLKVGHWRALTRAEVEALLAAADEPPGADTAFRRGAGRGSARGGRAAPARRGRRSPGRRR